MDNLIDLRLQHKLAVEQFYKTEHELQAVRAAIVQDRAQIDEKGLAVEDIANLVDEIDRLEYCESFLVDGLQSAQDQANITRNVLSIAERQAGDDELNRLRVEQDGAWKAIMENVGALIDQVARFKEADRIIMAKVRKLYPRSTIYPGKRETLISQLSSRLIVFVESYQFAPPQLFRIVKPSLVTISRSIEAERVQKIRSQLDNIESELKIDNSLDGRERLKVLKADLEQAEKELEIS